MIVSRLRAAWVVMAVGVPALAGPVGAQTETSLADLLAGTAVPHAVKLKDLTPEWRRLNITGEAMLGMGGMMQSMMQSVGSMFGGGGSDALYTRGATLKIGDQQFLVAYRLPSGSVDFASLVAAGAGAAGGGAGGGPPRMPPPKPVTPETELSLTLVNVRAIASISDIRPFNMAEATKAAASPLLDAIKSAGEKAPPPAAAPKKK